jgi:nucleotide-binding universal stress UspA family protein
MTTTYQHILCAVRGHPQSRATATRAIELALAHQARLTFVHNLDISYLEHATVGTPRVAYQMLREMAEFAMLLLVDRAQRRGVSDVRYVFLEGEVRKQLMQYAAETNADVLVIGVPEGRQEQEGRAVFTPDALQAFVSEIEQDARLPVIVVKPAGDEGP